MKKLFTLLILAITFMLISDKAFANTSCQTIYGGGESCIQTGNIVINKTVQNPSNGLYVDVLNINDPKYAPNQTVNFQITITNTEDSVISTVTVKDVLPQFVTFVSGPGTYDANTNTLTFEIKDFPKKEAKTFTIQGKISDSAKFPFTDGTTCVVNQAIMNASNGQSAQDNAQFCIQTKVAPTPVTTKGGLPVLPAPKIVTTPSTGPEMLPLLALIPSGIAGFILRKKSK